MIADVTERVNQTMPALEVWMRKQMLLRGLRLAAVTAAVSLAGASEPANVGPASTDVVTPEMFGAIGDGVSDDTAAWRAAAEDGRPIVANGSYRISDTIELVKPGAYLSGAGHLIATEHMAAKSLLKSSSDDCLIQGLNFHNPTEAQEAEGARNIAIEVAADRCRIIGNRIDRFQNGIVVSAAGEYYDTLIRGNIVQNVIGVGGGPRDAETVLGEDRGDGIVSWGSRTRILDNQVRAKPGTDARIGIHVEGLAVYHTRPTRPSDEAGAVIRNNRVEGPFRRGIVNEAVRDVLIEDNDLPGGYTWWGIAVVQEASDTVVRGNRITFDRTPSNRAGARWSPWYAAVHLAAYGDSSLGHVVVEDNQIRVPHGGGAAIQYQNAMGDAHRFTPATIRNNRVWAVGAGTAAVRLLGGTRLARDSGNNSIE